LLDLAEVLMYSKFLLLNFIERIQDIVLLELPDVDGSIFLIEMVNNHECEICVPI
jgi:hypothetical protein